MKKIGAVVVTYNPSSDVIDNINRVVEQVDLVIVVDNGTSNFSNSSLNKKLELIDKIKVIINHENMGIAEALNQGCDYLLKNSYSTAFLMDQDSIVEPLLVSKLLKCLCENKAAMVSPDIKLNGVSSDGSLKAKYLVPVDGLFFKRESIEDFPLEVLFNITSGSLLELSVWNEIGRFWSELFIDGVDTEFGLRLNKNGHKILILNDAFLFQQYGEMEEKCLFGKKFYPTNHAAIRHYYMNRNRLLIWRKYWRSHPNYVIWDVLSLCNVVVKICLFEENKKSKIKFSMLGFYDGLTQNTGKCRFV